MTQGLVHVLLLLLYYFVFFQLDVLPVHRVYTIYPCLLLRYTVQESRYLHLFYFADPLLVTLRGGSRCSPGWRLKRATVIDLFLFF